MLKTDSCGHWNCLGNDKKKRREKLVAPSDSPFSDTQVIQFFVSYSHAFSFPGRTGWFLTLDSSLEASVFACRWCSCLHSRQGVWPQSPQEEQPRGSSFATCVRCLCITQPVQALHAAIAKHQPQGQRRVQWRTPWKAAGMKAASAAWAALGLGPAAAALGLRQGNWALRSVKSQYLLQGPSQVSEQVFGHHEVGKKIISVIGQRLNCPLQNSLTHGFHVT